jgi:hypothetical protein
MKKPQEDVPEELINEELSEGNNLKSCGNFKKMKLQYRHK